VESTSGIRACREALNKKKLLLHTRPACYKKIDQDSAYMMVASKVRMLKPGVETTIAPTTPEEKAQRRLELKARSPLLIGIPNEHQFKFNSIKDAKSLLQAIEKRLQKLISQMEIHGESISQEDVNQNFLRSLSPKWNIHTIVWRNKPEIDTLSLDDLYNNMKFYEPEDLQQIYPDDLEDMDLRWQMAMITMRSRRFLKNTRRKFSMNSNETIGFDKSKVKCYNCQKSRHFARECRAPRNQENRNRESLRRSVPVETPASLALVSCDGNSGYDWSDQAEEGPTNFALIAYSSTSSNSESVEARLLVYKKIRKFMPPKPDFSFSSLEEFVNEPIVSEPTVKNPIVETSEAKASVNKPKVVRKNFGSPFIEDWISNSEDEAESKPKIEKKTVKPSFAKRVNTFRSKTVNTARSKAVVNVVLVNVVNAKTIIVEVQLQALVDGKKVIITESTVRRDLQLEDAEGVDCLPNAAIFEQLTLVWKTKRKDTELPQTSSPTTNIADEAINEEMNDSLKRASTTASSLEAEEASGNINKTQSKNMVLDLENIKTTQALKINSMKRRVKKLEKKQRSRTHKLKRLYNGRFNDQKDAEMLFDVADDLRGEEVFVSQEVPFKEVNVAAATTTTVTIDDITLAKALIEIKSAKPKADKVVIQEPKQGTTITTTTTATIITATSTRPKAKWFVIHEYEQAPTPTVSSQQPSQVKVQDKAKRTVEKRNIPPTRAQQRSIMCTYLKNIEGWKTKSLKNKSFANIQELFDKVMKKMNTFVDYKTELVVESLKDAEAKVIEGSSKRAREELEQENAKKQKMEDDKEYIELKQCLEIILEDGDDVTIDATPLSSKSPTIIDYKFHKERKKSYFQIFRADGNSQMYLTLSKMLKILIEKI
nr:hypothetical protein [Tanacetum cinerariifolium]